MPTGTSMSPDQLRDALGELRSSLQEIETLDHTSMSAFSSVAASVASRVNRTLAKVFGRDASEYRRCVVTPSLFKPSGGERRQSQRSAAFASGKEKVARNLRREIELLEKLLPTHVVTREFPVLVETSVPPLSAEGALAAASTVVPAERIVISPTIYPQGPGGTVIVANSIAINTANGELQRFREDISELLEQLRGSNEASPEVRRQLTGELKAGSEILNTPKPDRGALKAYLVRPLQFIAKEFASGTIRALAKAALAVVAKWLGLF
jgi:hypothetical protein